MFYYITLCAYLGACVLLPLPSGLYSIHVTLLILKVLFVGVTVHEIFKDVIGPDGKPMVVRQLVITQPLQSLASGLCDSGNSSQQVFQSSVSETNCCASTVTSQSANKNDVIPGMQGPNVNDVYSAEEGNGVHDAVFLCQPTDANISPTSLKRLESLAYGDENSKDVWLGYNGQSTHLVISPSDPIYAHANQNLSTATANSGHLQSGEKKLTTGGATNQGPVLLKTENETDWVHNVCSPAFHVPENFLKTGGSPTCDIGVAGGQLHSPGLSLVASSPIFEGMQLGDMLPMEVTLLPFAYSPPPEFIITNVASLATPTMNLAVSPSNSEMSL